MKESAGEANMTVITIVLIALVLAVGTPLINSMLKRMSRSSCCSSIGGELKDNGRSGWTCYVNGEEVAKATYWDESTDKCKY